MLLSWRGVARGQREATLAGLLPFFNPFECEASGRRAIFPSTNYHFYAASLLRNAGASEPERRGFSFERSMLDSTAAAFGGNGS